MRRIIGKTAVVVFAACLVCSVMLLFGCSNSTSSGNTTSASSSSNTNSNANSNTSKNTNGNSNANANKNANSNKNANASSASAKSEPAYINSVDENDPYASGIHHATVTVEGYDPFVIELDADNAPITVSNFCKLANDKFYDGLTFYRFQKDFCMQGGSSNNSAAMADDGLESIKGEFSSNGVNNKIADNFKKGTVAMARSSNPNSATSTFFVTLSSGEEVSMSLDGQYAAFGTIAEDGMKTVDSIVADHLKAASGDSMGMIDDVSQQAKITSIVIDD